MKIRIVPNDTLFFRDGKPFSREDETWADGIFPPFPSTLYGSLRTKYIAEQKNGYDDFLNEKVIEVIGTKEAPPKNGFKLNSIYLGYSKESIASLDRHFFPTPMDMARYKDENNKFVLLNPKRIEGFNSSCPLPQVLTIENVKEELKSAANTYIQDVAFYRRYFLGFGQDIQIMDLENILVEEPKVGIGRNDATHTSQESRLYRVGMSRMNLGWSIYAEMEGLKSSDLFSNVEQSTFIKLGGEGKTANIYFVDTNETAIQEDIDELLNFIQGHRRFKLYFMTPAMFENGWFPDFVDKNYHIKKFPEFKLEAAAVGKTVHIGGWDMANNRSKDMMRAVPAGSVYFFEADNNAEINAENLKKEFHRNNHGKRKDEGFGYCLMTIWR